MVENRRAEKSRFLGLGQDQQQHPAVHTGGVSRGRSVDVAVGLSGTHFSVFSPGARVCRKETML